MTEVQFLNEIRQTISSPQLWEYATYQTHKPQDAQKDFLNDYGNDAWELVNVAYCHADGFVGEMTTMFFFKRPVTSG